MEVFDVCIVGAGVEGSSTARYLASRGKRTLLLEQFTLPHSFGSSHGESRIIRYGYAQEFYSDLMPESFSMWREIEQMSGKTLIKEIGLLTIKDPPYEQMAETVKNVRRLGQPCFLLTAEEIMKRYPALNLAPEEIGTFEPTSGMIQADLAVKTLQEQFVMFGGVLRDGEKVLDIKTGSVVKILTSEDMYKAKNVVLTPGPWINKLLSPLGLTLPLSIQRIEVPHWEVCKPELYNIDSGLPIFLFYNPFGKKDWNVLGFPTVDDPSVIKVVPNLGKEIKDPDSKIKGQLDDVPLTRTMEVIKVKLPGVKPQPVSLEPCYYTLTPDRDFVIDRHPNFHNIIIGAGFSGHGFKMAPVIGKILSQLALGQRTEYDIMPFRISRFQNVGPKASL